MPILASALPTVPVGSHQRPNHICRAVDEAHTDSEPLLWHLVVGLHRYRWCHPLLARPRRPSRIVHPGGLQDVAATLYLISIDTRYRPLQIWGLYTR